MDEDELSVRGDVPTPRLNGLESEYGRQHASGWFCPPKVPHPQESTGGSSTGGSSTGGSSTGGSSTGGSSTGGSSTGGSSTGGSSTGGSSTGGVGSSTTTSTPPLAFCGRRTLRRGSPAALAVSVVASALRTRRVRIRRSTVFEWTRSFTLALRTACASSPSGSKNSALDFFSTGLKLCFAASALSASAPRSATESTVASALFMPGVLAVAGLALV